MRAAAELAKAVGDESSASAFSKAAARGTASLDTLQWVNASTWTTTPGTYCMDNFEYVGSGLSAAECQANCTAECSSVFMSSNTSSKDFCYKCSGGSPTAPNPDYNLYTKSGSVEGSWAAASDGCTDQQGCATQHGFFGDTLYAQVLAYSVGLGTIVSSEDKLRSHLKQELATNCAHAVGEGLVEGCDNAGIVILTGRETVGVTDWQIWEGGPPNHASVAIRSGEQPASPSQL